MLLFSDPVADKIYTEIKSRVAQLKNPPGLATILIGNDEASQIYISRKQTIAQKLGFQSSHKNFSSSSDPAEVIRYIQEKNKDPLTSGILVQKPLPSHFPSDEIFNTIDPNKDVDGFTDTQVAGLAKNAYGFSPCTPMGILYLFNHYGVSLEGARALVIGRSMIVGHPMAELFLHNNATVTIAHSKTSLETLKSLVAQSDIIVAAAGRPRLLDASFEYKSTAIVIDVGIHRSSTGRLEGDVVTSEVEPLVRGISPVPGGVGPMTIACLMLNTLKAAEKNQDQL